MCCCLLTQFTELRWVFICILIWPEHLLPLTEAHSTFITSHLVISQLLLSSLNTNGLSVQLISTTAYTCLHFHRMPLGKHQRLCLNGWFEMQVHGTVRLECFGWKSRSHLFPLRYDLSQWCISSRLILAAAGGTKFQLLHNLRFCANFCFLTSCDVVLGMVLLVSYT